MKQNLKQTVVILGASDKPDRYAYKAFKQLEAKGHLTILVHPTLKEVEGVKVFANLSDIKGTVNTITVYVNPSISTSLSSQIIALKPNRVIFNPGAENESLAMEIKNRGIAVENACTLVLLSTEQF